MKKIIFDLDGTIWETGKGYIYSYNKTCRQLNIPEDKIKGDDYVLAYLGMKLEELVRTIIPEASDKQQLGLMLLQNVIEYQLTHPETYSKNIVSLFEKLSSQYEVYIISNCPRPFLEAFYSISGVKQYVTGDNTIEDSNKAVAIKKITNNYSEKALFIGDAKSDYDSIENHSVVQFVYASYGYCKDCDDYNYYLDDLDQFPELLSNITPMIQLLNEDSYEVISHKGTSVTVMDKKDCWYFGFMNIKNQDDFDVVLEKLKEKCRGKTVYGPINKNSWYSYRTTLNNFDFKLYPDCEGSEEIVNKFYKHGFELAEKYTSTLTSLNLDKWSFKDAKLQEGFEGKIVKGEDCKVYLKEIYEISCRCFEDHAFYEEIDLETFMHLYESILSHCSPYLVAITFKGKLVGFNFMYPDLENRFVVDKTVAIDKDYRNAYVLIKLLDLSHQVIQGLGFDQFLMHFQNVKNVTMQSYFRGTIINQKEYGVFKYESAE